MMVLYFLNKIDYQNNGCFVFHEYRQPLQLQNGRSPYFSPFYCKAIILTTAYSFKNQPAFLQYVGKNVQILIFITCDRISHTNRLAALFYLLNRYFRSQVSIYAIYFKENYQDYSYEAINLSNNLLR